MIGINLSGAEYGTGGWYARDYIYPSETDLRYYADQGIGLVRLPFRWERMQMQDGSLRADELGRLQNFLNEAAAVGVKVVVDLHNFGQYKGDVIGSPKVPVARFADFWETLASAIKNYPALLGYDLMNEPIGINPSDWQFALQTAVDAIRQIDMQHNIYVQGSGWSGAWDWPKVNGHLDINDPADKLYYEAHIYFDSDSSGFYNDSYDKEGAYPRVGGDRLKPFTDWLKETGNKGFIGEYGIPNDDPRWLEVMGNFLEQAKAEGLDTAYFGAGPWSSGDRNALVGPNGVPNPQLATLLDHVTAEGFSVQGRSAPDVLIGSVADDRLSGLAGYDTLRSHDGRDVLDGGAGADRMVGGRGADGYFVDDPGDQPIELPGEGSDVVTAYVSYALPDAIEHLLLRAGAGIDGIGNALDNRIEGNGSANLLMGRWGNDTLVGRGGADRLQGGPGSDIYDYNLLGDSRGTEIDRILDFRQGADKIDISSIDANAKADGNQTFSFIGQAAFGGAAGEVRHEARMAETDIFVDVDGDRIADMQIRLAGKLALTQWDLLL